MVYAGPNGSGKSTIRDIAGVADGVPIDPDRIAREYPMTTDAAGAKAAREAVERFRAAVASGVSVTLETTLSGKTVLRRMKAAKAAGYRVSLFYVSLLSPEDNIVRIAARVATGGHYLPDGVVRRRVVASQENLPAALTIAEYAKVYDNSGPVHWHLLTVEHRRIVFEARLLPVWLELIPPR